MAFVLEDGIHFKNLSYIICTTYIRYIGYALTSRAVDP